MLNHIDAVYILTTLYSYYFSKDFIISGGLD